MTIHPNASNGLPTAGKDCLGHVRVVHFTLIIVTLGLLLTIWSNRFQPLETASSQLTTIQRIAEAFPDPKSLEHLVYDSAGVPAAEYENITADRYSISTSTASVAKIDISDVSVPRLAHSHLPKFYNDNSDEDDVDTRTAPSADPTLERFVAFWDRLRQPIDVLQHQGLGNIGFATKASKTAKSRVERAQDQMATGGGLIDLTDQERINLTVDVIRGGDPVCRVYDLGTTRTRSDAKQTRSVPIPNGIGDVIASTVSSNCQHVVMLSRTGTNTSDQLAVHIEPIEAQDGTSSVAVRLPVKAMRQLAFVETNSTADVFAVDFVTNARYAWRTALRYQASLISLRDQNAASTCVTFPGMTLCQFGKKNKRFYWTAEGRHGVYFVNLDPHSPSTRQLKETLVCPNVRIDQLAVSPDESAIGIVGRQTISGEEYVSLTWVRCDDLHETLLQKWAGSIDSVGIEFAENGKTLVVALADINGKRSGNVVSWQIEAGNIEPTSGGPTFSVASGVRQITVSADASRMALLDGSGRLIVWPDNTTPGILLGKPTRIRLSGDGRKLFASYRATVSLGSSDDDDVALRRCLVGNNDVAPKTQIAAELPNTFGVDDDDETLFILCDTPKITQVSLQSEIRKKIDAKFLIGPFSQSFPELAQLTKKYGSNRLLEVSNILRDEEKQAGGEKFEVLGIKIQASILSRAGIALIVLVQLYLLVQLRAVAIQLNLKDDIYESAWIGIYASQLARACTIATICIVPALNAIVLGLNDLQGSVKTLEFWIALAAVSLTACLCWVEYRLLSTLWRKLSGVLAAAATTEPGLPVVGRAADLVETKNHMDQRRSVGQDFGALINIFSGLTIATGLAQVAPRLCGYAAGPLSDTFQFAAFYALALAAVEAVAIYFDNPGECHPAFILIDFIGQLLIFFMFATANDSRSYFIVFSVFLWSLVAHGVLRWYWGARHPEYLPQIDKMERDGIGLRVIRATSISVLTFFGLYKSYGVLMLCVGVFWLVLAAYRIVCGILATYTKLIDATKKEAV